MGGDRLRRAQRCGHHGGRLLRGVHPRASPRSGDRAGIASQRPSARGHHGFRRLFSPGVRIGFSAGRCRALVVGGSFYRRPFCLGAPLLLSAALTATVPNLLHLWSVHNGKLEGAPGWTALRLRFHREKFSQQWRLFCGLPLVCVPRRGNSARRRRWALAPGAKPHGGPRARTVVHPVVGNFHFILCRRLLLRRQLALWRGFKCPGRPLHGRRPRRPARLAAPRARGLLRLGGRAADQLGRRDALCPDAESRGRGGNQGCGFRRPSLPRTPGGLARALARSLHVAPEGHQLVAVLYTSSRWCITISAN